MRWLISDPLPKDIEDRWIPGAAAPYHPYSTPSPTPVVFYCLNVNVYIFHFGQRISLICYIASSVVYTGRDTARHMTGNKEYQLLFVSSLFKVTMDKNYFTIVFVYQHGGVWGSLLKNGHHGERNIPVSRELHSPKKQIWGWLYIYHPCERSSIRQIPQGDYTICGEEHTRGWAESMYAVCLSNVSISCVGCTYI